ncbi:MAG TPA: hypothetical protein VKB12_17255 [Pyrinomonadaceae bacterium]|nr:hypothetical protein [Pyrinomonadaceae bacterium]
MRTALQELVGLEVSKASLVHDYLQVFFEGGAILNVYNVFHLSGGAAGDGGAPPLDASTLAAVKEEVQEVELTFSNGVVISIDMRDEAYQGPEALELIRAGSPTVVWRSDDAPDDG